MASSFGDCEVCGEKGVLSFYKGFLICSRGSCLNSVDEMLGLKGHLRPRY